MNLQQNCLKGQVELAWGVPFSPDEFIQEACRRGHPKLLTKLVPGILQMAIFKNFASSSLGDLQKERAEWFSKWMNRAKELKVSERELKQSLPKHAQTILAPKRLLVWKEILEDLEYPDMGVVDEMIHGTELVGEVPPFGIFEKTFKPADMTVDQLRRSSASSRRAQFFKCRSSGDAEIDTLVFQKTQEEVNLGWASGPWSLDDLPEGAVISRRFGLRQPGKIPLIDDLSGSDVNSTVQCAESPKPHSVDFIAAMLLGVLKLKLCGGVQVHGRSFDLKSAYKQLSVAFESLRFAFVAVYNPESKAPEIYQLLAAPFGATRSVYSFPRISHAIWFTGVKALHIVWSCFFDDFVAFCMQQNEANTETTVELLFRLLGWNFAVDGDKATSFSDRFSALGVEILLEHAGEGKVCFANTERRTSELLQTIQGFLNKGKMTVVESQKLRGRMQFADGQIFGRLGKLCLRALTKHAFPFSGPTLSKDTTDA